MGCFTSNAMEALSSLPPTLSTPFSSRKGSSLKSELVCFSLSFLVWAFWRLWNIQTLSLRLRTIWISSVKFQYCTNLRIASSAKTISSTVGEPVTGLVLYCLFGRFRSIILWMLTMLLFNRMKEDEWLKRFNSRTTGKILFSFLLGTTPFEMRTAAFTFLISASSGSKCGTGLVFTTVTLLSHKKPGPLNQISSSASCLALVPFEAMSAGLFGLAT